VTAVMSDDGSFAVRLDRAIARAKEIGPKMIEQAIVDVESSQPDEGQPTEGPSRPFGPLPDRRFRR